MGRSLTRVGNVYEAMFALAQKEPLNRSQVADGVRDYLQPLMRDSRALIGLSSKL